MWYELYLKNAVTITTLDKLIKAGKLTQQDFDTMVTDRLVQYGY